MTDTTTPTAEAREPTNEHVREAMQTAWDDFCDDAQAIPGDIYRVGHRTYFSAGTWADHTAMHLRAMLSRPTAAPDGATLRDGNFDVADDPNGFVGVRVLLGGNVYLTQRNPENDSEDQIILSRQQAEEMARIILSAQAPESAPTAAPDGAKDDEAIRAEGLSNAEANGMDKGAEYVLNQLAGALGVTDWEQGDGSETWHGDVSATVFNILEAGKVYDPETDAIARLTAHPSPSAEVDADERIEEMAMCLCRAAKDNAIFGTFTDEYWRRMALAALAPADAEGRG